MDHLKFAAVIVTFIAVAVMWAIETQESEVRKLEQEIGQYAPVGTRLPNGNGFGGTLGAEELAALANAGYETVIRLNGNAPDRERGRLSISQEGEICEDLDLRFYYFNIEASGDSLNGENVEFILDILDRGNVFIHCRNGAHRAPAMVAYWLMRQNDLNRMPKEEIIDLIGWGDLVKNPGQYERYTRVLSF